MSPSHALGAACGSDANASIGNIAPPRLDAHPRCGRVRPMAKAKYAPLPPVYHPNPPGPALSFSRSARRLTMSLGRWLRDVAPVVVKVAEERARKGDQ